MGYEHGHYQVKINEPDDSLTIRLRKHASERAGPVGVYLTALVDHHGTVQGPLFKPLPHTRINQIASIVHRFGRKMPWHDGDERKSLLKFSKEMIMKIFTPIVACDVPSFDTWINNSGYPGSRRKYLTELRRSITQINSDVFTSKSFLKDEGYLSPKQPRSINSYTDESKVILGPLVHAIDKATFKNKYFVKGQNVRDRPRVLFDMFSKRKVMGTDFSSFEAHHANELAEIVHFWFMHMIRNCNISNMHKRMISRMVKGVNTSVFSQVQCEVSQRLMSGALWTSSSNGVLNLMLMMYLSARTVLERRRGMAFTHEDLIAYACYEFNGLVEGDDGICEEVNVDEAIIRRLGLELKLDHYDNFGDASFCGIVCDPEELENVSDPVKFLRGFFILPAKLAEARDNVLKTQLRAKALSYKYALNNCPIIGPVCQAVCDATRGITVCLDTAETDSYKRHLLADAIVARVWRDKPCVSLKTRLLVERKFGVTVERQIEIERMLTHIELGTHPVCDIGDLLDDVTCQHSIDFVTSTPNEFVAPPKGYVEPSVLRICDEGLTGHMPLKTKRVSKYLTQFSMPIEAVE